MTTTEAAVTSSGLFSQFKNWLEAPVPLEQSDPDLAEHIRLVANRQHPVVKTIVAEKRSVTVIKHDGSRTVRHAVQPGRNDPCPCGSGKKFKKCCA